MSTASVTPDLGFSQQDLDDLQAIHGHLGEDDPRKEKLAGLLQQHGVEMTPPKEFKPGFAEGAMGAAGMPSTPEELTAAEESAKPSLKDFATTATGLKPLAMLGGIAKDYASNLYDRGKDAVHEAYEAGQNIGNEQPVVPNLGKAALGGYKAFNAAIPLVGEQANKVGEDVAKGNTGAALGRGLGTLALMGAGGEEAGGEHPAVSKFAAAESNPHTLYHSYLDPVASTPHNVPPVPAPVLRAVVRDMEAAGDGQAAARIKSGKATIGDLDTARQSANRLSSSIYRSPGNYSPGLAKGADKFAADIRDGIYPAIESANGLPPDSLRGIKKLQGDMMKSERNPTLAGRLVKNVAGGGLGYAAGHAVGGPVGGSIGGTLGVAAAEPVAAGIDRGVIALRTKRLGMKLP